MTNLRIKLSIFFNFFLFAILLNSIGTVILQSQRYFGILASSAAVLEVCKDVSLALVSFLIASYITRVGYRKSMLIALGIMALTCMAIPSLKTFLAVKILFIVCGACFALMKISILGTIGLITKNEREHASLMNFIESFFMVGILTGYLIFSYYINDFNSRSPQWFNVYYLLAACSSIAFLWLLVSPLDESSLKSIRVAGSRKNFASMADMVMLPLVLSFVLSVCLYTLVEQTIMCWLPTFNNKQLQLSSSTSVQISALLAGAIAAGRFCTGMIIKKISWIKVLIGSLLGVMILILVTLPFTTPSSPVNGENWQSIPWVAYIFPITGFFLAPVYPVINSVILSALPGSQHARMAGLILLFSSVGGMSGSMITGFIFDSYGGPTAFYFSLVPILLLIGALLFFRKMQDRELKVTGYTQVRIQSDKLLVSA